MSKEQDLEWDQIPEELREICHRWVDVFSPAHSLKLANQIMQAIKPIVEKAYVEGMIKMNYQDMPLSYMKSHFETY